MIAVVDTNVLLSAALRDRLPEQVVLFVAMRDEWKWIVTPQIMAEYVEVLRRPKFRLSPETLNHWADLVAMRTVNIGSPSAAGASLRDPKDAPFLAATLAGGADYLITGDRDLLAAKGLVPTRIVTVAEFAQEFAVA
jgi:putative PIN family toxin of toxin-antitoxin system